MRILHNPALKTPLSTRLLACESYTAHEHSPIVYPVENLRINHLLSSSMPAGASHEVEACRCLAKEHAGRASDDVRGRREIDCRALQ